MSYNTLHMMRNFTNNVIDESALFNGINENSEGDSCLSSDLSEFKGFDEEFISECISAAIPVVMSAEIMAEDAEVIEGIIAEASERIADYLAGQGIINEAGATKPVINNRLNVVHLNKEAQIARLTKIYTLKLGRMHGTNNYKKYKIGTMLRKTNMEAMVKQFGSQAARMAKQAYNKLKNNPKGAVVISDQRKKIKNKK